MSKNYTLGDDVLVQKKPASKGAQEKELAEDLLQSKGYVPAPKPRRVNGGQDLTSAKHTAKNKERLNRTLSKAPAQAKKSTPKKKEEASPVPVASQKTAAPFPISYIFFIAIITVIMVYVVHLYIEISDLDASLTEYNNTLDELMVEQRDLLSEKANLYNPEEVARIAREEYGMVSEDQLPKEYITPDSDDEIEIVKTASEESAAGVLMTTFGAAVSNLLSYIN